MLVFLLVLVGTSLAGSSSSNPDICDDGFWIVHQDPFAHFKDTCASAQQQIDSTWCSQEPACLGDSTATAAATVPTVTTGPVSTYLQQFPGLGFAYTATGFVLPTTNGGPSISRGVVFIPETGVAGEAYAPIARNMSGRGFYAFVLTETNGKTTAGITSDVYAALATHPELTAWTLVGHGNGGSVASKIIADDNNRRFNCLAMLGAVTYPGADLRNVNLELVYVYGGQDTVVTPAQALNTISNYLPRDALVIRMPNAAHMDFAFTTCVGNSFTPGLGGCGNFRLANPLASLTLPAAGTGDSAVVNAGNPIVQTNGATGFLADLGSSCRTQGTAYHNDTDGTWVSIFGTGDDLSDYLYADGGSTLQIIARPNKRDYTDVRNLLEGKRVRASFNCRDYAVQCVEFTVGNAPELTSNAFYTLAVALAPPQTNLYSAIAQLLGLVGRAATPRGLSFLDNSVLYPVGAQNNSKIYPANYYAPVETQTINVPSTDPNVPLNTQWYVFRPKAPVVPLGAYVYYPGAAVQAQAYSALAFEIAARGYLVVIPTVPLRIATLDVPVFGAIYNSSYFPDVPAGKWAVGGHSLGGIAACQAVVAFPSLIKALVMHAGGLVASFVNRPQRVAQIYGSLDGLSPGGSERFHTPYIPLTNPSNTQFVAIQGGVHWGFADYGYHYPDNVPTIPIESEQSQAAQLAADNLAIAFQ